MPRDIAAETSLTRSSIGRNAHASAPLRDRGDRLDAPQSVLVVGQCAADARWALRRVAARRSAIISWGIINAVWTGEDGRACRVEGSGACWAFVKAKFSQFVYGRYPDEERWRVDLSSCGRRPCVR